MLSKLKTLNLIFNNTPLDFRKALGGELWISVNYPEQNKLILKQLINLFKNFLRVIYNSIATIPIIKFPKSNKLNIFFIRKHSRTNIDIHTKYFEDIEHTTTCVFKNKKIKIDFLTIFFCIFFLIKFRKLWLEPFKFYKIKFLSIEGLKIFINLFDSVSDSIKVLPILMKHKKLVAFQDHVMVENIICQLANKNEITTFGLQHAIGLYKENNLTFENDYHANTTYEPSVSQNILVWGEYSKNTFEKFTNAKIHIIGKPDMPNFETPQDGVTLIFQDPILKENNSELLKIFNFLKDHNVPTSLWFKQGHILIKNCKVREGPIRKIVIGATSTLCFELGFLGFKVFMLKEKVSNDSIADSLKLSDIDLIAKNYKSIENYPNHLWKRFIESSGDETVKKYKEALKI